jgi:hypothetical protein
MFDLSKIEGFDWDAGNARKSVDKHDVSQAEAEQVFLNQPLLILMDSKHSMDEPRWHALGVTHHGRGLHVTLTLRHLGRKLRVISARDMSRKERDAYQKYG